MDELKKNNIVEIELSDGSIITGVVLDLSYDRVSVLVNDDSATAAAKLSELESIKVLAKTSFGLKTMRSHVISSIDGRNCIIIENNPSANTLQRREHVRVTDDFIFAIKYQGNTYKPKCINVSGGGIAFEYDKDTFQLGQKVDLIFENNHLILKEFYLNFVFEFEFF